MRKSIFPLLFIIMPLILSCWDSSPTSHKAKTYKIGGIVADKNGSGISGATVQITGVNYSSADTTDGGGIFAFESVKSGDYSVKAQKDSCFFKPAIIELAVTKTDVDTLKFTSADNYIHGRVLDILTDKGMAGVKVDIFNYNHQYCGTAITDVSGEFSFYDLEKSGYRYQYVPSYYTPGWTEFSFEPTAFANSEIILKTYYLSSEKLKITKAEFIKDTQTLNLEWNPSESKYIQGYFVWITNNPDELDNLSNLFPVVRGYYVDKVNKNSRIIKSQDIIDLFDDDIISGIVYLTVAAVYKIGNYTYYGPYQDMISIRLYW